MERTNGGPLKALIYDFDDTLVESERFNDALFSDLLRTEYGIDLSREEQDLLYGFSWTGVFSWLGAHRGLAAPRAAVWARFMAAKRRFFERTPLRLATGIHRMLSLPIPHAIVSGSTREEVRLMMAGVSLSPEMFRFILCDEDCAAGKPDPQGYLMALERLEVTPQDAVVFEDSPAGIEAARRAGIPVAFVAELASRDSGAEADMRFPSFVEAWESLHLRVAAP